MPIRLRIELAAAIVALTGAQPQILVASDDGADLAPALPAGPFDPVAHRTFVLALRAFTDAQTGLPLGYVEQLYTFGDHGRVPDEPSEGHAVSVSYLGLAQMPQGRTASFRPWYQLFPWEDWRDGRPKLLDGVILPLLQDWAHDDSADGGSAPARRERLAQCFGTQGAWDEERTLERYELLYEAGLVWEAKRDGAPAALARGHLPELGLAMRHDHRRIVATAIGRLRAKLKYRPVIFELMPDAFSLTQLQTAVESISGRHLHKQNFRRLIETSELVEPTGTMTRTSGRPAKLFRFRRDVLAERPDAGVIGQRR
jgi:hypothetical protein